MVVWWEDGESFLKVCQWVLDEMLKEMIAVCDTKHTLLSFALSLSTHIHLLLDRLTYI